MTEHVTTAPAAPFVEPTERDRQRDTGGMDWSLAAALSDCADPLRSVGRGRLSPGYKPELTGLISDIQRVLGGGVCQPRRVMPTRSDAVA
jgi:hypothetical protein